MAVQVPCLTLPASAPPPSPFFSAQLQQPTCALLPSACPRSPARRPLWDVSGENRSDIPAEDRVASRCLGGRTQAGLLVQGLGEAVVCPGTLGSGGGGGNSRGGPRELGIQLVDCSGHLRECRGVSQVQLQGSDCFCPGHTRLPKRRDGPRPWPKCGLEGRGQEQNVTFRQPCCCPCNPTLFPRHLGVAMATKPQSSPPPPNTPSQSWGLSELTLGKNIRVWGAKWPQRGWGGAFERWTEITLMESKQEAPLTPAAAPGVTRAGTPQAGSTLVEAELCL